MASVVLVIVQANVISNSGDSFISLGLPTVLLPTFSISLLCDNSKIRLILNDPCGEME